MEESEGKVPLLHEDETDEPQEKKWPEISKKFFATALLAAFLATADESFVLSTSREIAAGFGQISASTWLITGYSLGYLVSLPVYGQLCNIYGRRPTLLLAYSMFGIGCFLIGISPTITVAVAGRIISGFGASGMMDLLSVFLNEMAPPHKVPLLRSYVSMMSMVGRCSGAPIGSLLAGAMGWQWSFLAHIPAVLVCIVGAIAYIPLEDTDQSSERENEEGEKCNDAERPASNSRSLDIPGIILLAGAITTFLLFLQHLDPQEMSSAPKGVIISLGISSLVFKMAFLIFETWGASNPLIPLSLLRKNQIGIICLVTAFLHSGYIVIYSNVSEFYLRSTSVSVPVASSFLLPIAVGGSTGSVLAGIIIKKTCKNRLPSIFGTILAAASFAMILVRWCFADSPHNWEVIYTFTGGFGIGCAMSSQFFSLSVSVSSKEDNAISVTAYYLFQQIGAIAGVSMVNTLHRHFFENNLLASMGSDTASRETIEQILSDSHYAHELSPPQRELAHGAFRKSFFVVPSASSGMQTQVFVSKHHLSQRNLYRRITSFLEFELNSLYSSIATTDRMAQVQGHCEARFSKLRDLMQEFIVSGQDIGASLCININGENVVDIWGGYADASTKKLWEKDTIVNVFSTTKLVTNLAALMLISRGLLAPEDKVAQHWPEFAANGKSEVTVGQILAHTAGLSAWKDNMKLEDLYDIEAATDKLARQTPLWSPGTAMGYHGITQGFLVGELVRRKTGMSIDKFVRDEICQPLGDEADFQLGCPKEDWNRVAPVVPPPGPSIREVLSQLGRYEQDSIMTRTLCNPEPRAEDANTELWRSSTLGSVNGHTNARALVKILSCFSLGGTCAGEGHRLLSPETVKLALTEHATGIDLVTGRSGRRGLGVYLTGPGSGSVEGKLPEGNVGWGSGWGGSTVVMDSDRRLTIAYTMNRMLSAEHPSPAAYIKAVYEILRVTQAA